MIVYTCPEFCMAIRSVNFLLVSSSGFTCCSCCKSATVYLTESQLSPLSTPGLVYAYQSLFKPNSFLRDYPCIWRRQNLVFITQFLSQKLFAVLLNVGDKIITSDSVCTNCLISRDVL